MAIKANKFKTIDLLSPPQAEKNKEQKSSLESGSNTRSRNQSSLSGRTLLS